MRVQEVLAMGIAVQLGAATAIAQPVIDEVRGVWEHEATVTVEGRGFGEKPRAEPLVWDDASGTQVQTLWDGAWPVDSTNRDFNLKYRDPIRGVKPPHGRIGRYLAGAHGESKPRAGYNVMVWKAYAQTGTTYASFWYQIDPAWTTGGDNNHKMGIHSTGEPPYVPPHFHIIYAGGKGPSSATAAVQWNIYSGREQFLRENPRRNFARTWTGGRAGTNPTGRWVKVEYVAKWSAGDDGFFRIYDDGALVLDYRGRTDAAPGTARAQAFGGFARPYGESTNWRYFTDLYFDTSHARVILGNRERLDDCTVREVQIPQVWSDGSVTIQANLGTFTAGDTAYLFVVDGNNEVNTRGAAVRIGGGSGGTPETAPAAPTGLRIIGR